MGQREISVCVACFLLFAGCGLREGDAKANKPDPLPAGGSCRAATDCPEGQICQDGVCRYRHGSVRGRALAVTAHRQLDAGTAGKAARLYQEALDAYKQVDAPIPPVVLCSAARASLRVASSPQARERGARRAYDCIHGSLPGDPHRHETMEALAKLRFEGLNLAAFDEPEPPDRFFTKEPQRPKADQIEIGLELPEADEPGYDKVAEALRSDALASAVAQCFVDDWDRRHRRKAQASLSVELASELQDMGTYDVYPGEVTIEAASGGPFAKCVADKATSAVSDAAPDNLGRVVSWTLDVKVAARMP